MIKTLSLSNFSLQGILSKLLEQHGIPSGSELAKRVKLPIPTINRLLAGSVTDPRASTLVPIADYFGITVDQLLGKTPILTNENAFQPSIKIPIFSMSQLSKNESSKINSSKFFDYTIDSKFNISDNKLFAVEINNDEFLPVFFPDTTLIVNPNLLPPENKDYVLVKFDNSDTIAIKRFHIDPPIAYLESVIPGLNSVPYDQNQQMILGVICESYTQLK